METPSAAEIPVFARRRRKLFASLGDGALLLPTAPETLRNGDVHHPFRPGSDFHYLTGFPEPEAVLLAWRRGKEQRSVLFVRPRDPARETWDGRRHGVAGARRRFGVDAAHPIAELWSKLKELLPLHRRLFHTMGRDARFDGRLLELFDRLRQRHRRENAPAHPEIVDPLPAIASQRQIKDRHEIAWIERAAAISVAGHRAAMATARPGIAEFEIQAELEAEFRRRGSPRNGYPSIVASGANACVLHYTDNDRRTRAGDLVLVDAGAELGGYTADITRTWPVSGRFSEAQAAVYRIVLRAQKAGIRAVRPGAAWDAPHRACVRVLTRGLVDLGVLRGDVRKRIDKGDYRAFYMHGTSHWLGRDVHDAGAYQQAGKPVRLQAGMVLTVEPGLYFGARDRRVPAALRGIGVRIEDDVLVTRTGNRVLTAAAEKELREVEAQCQRRS